MASKTTGAKKITAKKPAKKSAKKVTAKKPASARRTAAKVSPLRGMAIDAWVAQKTSGWQRDVVAKMIAVVKAAAPESTATIKWSQPVFEDHGPFAYIRPAKAHVTFGFWRGVDVADPKGLLESGDRMGHFKLTAPEQLDERALAAMVKDAVRLNRAKGDPTKRG